MKRLTDHLRVLLLRMGLSFVALFLSQLYFLAVNAEHFSPAEFGVWHGMAVFLISSVCFINAPLLLGEMIPHPWRLKRWYRKFLRFVFLLTNSHGLAANLADAHFFDYTLKRSTADVLDLMGRDAGMARLIPSFVRDYWPAVLVLALLVFGLYRVDRKIRLRFQARERLTWGFYIRHTILFLFVFAAAVFASRGGFRLKPIAPISANNYTTPANVPLALNTPFTVIRTLGSGTFEAVDLMPADDAVRIFPLSQRVSGMTHDTPPNLVVIILESFGNEFAGSGRADSPTPFLDSLMAHSLTPKLGFANGQRSIDALPAIISGIPTMMNAPFVSSVYGSNRIESVPKKLKSLGYVSSFFHGGNNGTMGFDDYAESAGFDRYIGLNEYPKPADNDGTWGIYDEPFLQFSLEEMGKQTQPFFSCVFTLSSHHPYSVPDKLKDRIPENLPPIERSIRYADFSLKQFFAAARKMTWYENTVFILTADHSPASDHLFYRNAAGRFLVPVAFYSPNQTILPTAINDVVQHADLPLAMLHLAGYSGPFFSVGANPFNPAPNHVVPCFSNEVFQFNDGRLLYQFDGEKSVALYEWVTDSLLENNLLNERKNEIEALERKMKALLTSYGNALTNNQMTTE